MEDIDVLLRPGIPGSGREHLDDGAAVFPSISDDFIKLLREQGVQADYDRPLSERAELSQKAADVWLPVLELVQAVSIEVLAGCIVALVTNGRSQLHAKVGRRRKDKTEWLEVSGSRDDVIEAIGQFLQDDDEQPPS